MERLTVRCINGGATRSNPQIDYEKIINRLAQYEDLEEQGKLIKIPCGKGDVAYITDPHGVEEKVVKNVCVEINYMFTDNTVAKQIATKPQYASQMVFTNRCAAEIEYEQTYGRWKE